MYLIKIIIRGVFLLSHPKQNYNTDTRLAVIVMHYQQNKTIPGFWTNVSTTTINIMAFPADASTATFILIIKNPVSLMDQNKSRSVPWTPCFQLLRVGSPCGPVGRWGDDRSPSFCTGTQNKPAGNSEYFQHAAGSLTARYHTTPSFPPEKTWLSSSAGSILTQRCLI